MFLFFTLKVSQVSSAMKVSSQTTQVLLHELVCQLCFPTGTDRKGHVAAPARRWKSSNTTIFLMPASPTPAASGVIGGVILSLFPRLSAVGGGANTDCASGGITAGVGKQGGGEC